MYGRGKHNHGNDKDEEEMQTKQYVDRDLSTVHRRSLSLRFVALPAVSGNHQTGYEALVTFAAWGPF